MAFVLAFVFVVAANYTAHAQINNASDWNVPPPLPPSSVAKGSSTTGKTAAAILSLTDIPAASLPMVRSAAVPNLAPVSTTSPAVNAPDQPADPLVMNGIPEIPHPGMPDVPPLPKQTMQDVQIPPVTELPFTAAPEMPPLPPEPKATGQAAQAAKKGTLLLPQLTQSPKPTLPVNKIMMIWATPAIINNESSGPGPNGGKKN